jgi:PhnB protein
MKISPHIVVRDAARATEWYKRVFDATETRRVALPNGKLMAVALTIGDSSIHLADEFPELGVVSPLTVGGTSVTLTIETPDADAVWRRALAAGAEVVHPLADAFWGERHGIVRDPFGHRWGVAQHLRDVAPADIARAAAKAFGM